ncbi:unnamed protein product [Leptidea sinapis]|uniref:Myrosinase 1-like n=1 Tax=Leptidea sinapis TaxID=189913 RepID=A0A5E4Q5I2_9NEOP|nr:unnamed protein product [Leptidea sinapis]
MVIPVIFLLCICFTHAVQELSLNQSTFPPNFMIGASTSAYQTEGAWNVDGRGESSWDFVYHTIPDKVGYIHGDEAANSYYLWQKDVEIAKEMGLDFYRYNGRVLHPIFSKKGGWPPIFERFMYGISLQKGFNGSILPLFTEEEKSLIKGKGETEWDFIIHNFSNIIKDNATADVASDSYNLWEKDVQIAKEMGLNFYRFSISWSRILPTGFANEINNKGVQYYDNLINALLAAGIEPVVTLHHFDLPQNLQILGGWTNPYIVDWFLDYAKLIFSFYADRVKYWLTMNEPYIFCDVFYEVYNSPPIGTDSIVAPFICSKNAMVAHALAYRYYQRVYKAKYNGSADYVALNYYQGLKLKLTSSNSSQLLTPFNYAKLYVVGESDLEGAYSTPWLNHNVYPLGMRKAAAWINQQYGKWDILITENGYGGIDKTLTDNTRIQAMRDNLEQILLSIYEDHNNIIGYGYWSMIDVFAFANGYNVSFGLWDVDFKDPERPRTARDSARYFTCITQNRQLEPCDDLVKG